MRPGRDWEDKDALVSRAGVLALVDPASDDRLERRVPPAVPRARLVGVIALDDPHRASSRQPEPFGRRVRRRRNRRGLGRAAQRRRHERVVVVERVG